MDSNTFVINLEVAGRFYPVTIERGDEKKEEDARRAAGRVEELINSYKLHYKTSSIEERDFLAMAAIQLAMDLVQQEKRNDTQPFTEKIQQLTNEIDAYLKS